MMTMSRKSLTRTISHVYTSLRILGMNETQFPRGDNVTSVVNNGYRCISMFPETAKHWWLTVAYHSKLRVPCTYACRRKQA